MLPEKKIETLSQAINHTSTSVWKINILTSLSRFLAWSREWVPASGKLLPSHANTCKERSGIFCAALSMLCSLS